MHRADAARFRGQGWDKYPLGRFYSRFGRRWHSLAWYVEAQEDVEALFGSFIDNGIRVFDGRGGAVTDGLVQALFNFPRD